MLRSLSRAAPRVDVQHDLDAHEEQQAFVTRVEMQLRLVVAALRRFGAFFG